MKLCFRTRDVGTANDYPAIGWMPPLPSGADRLWRRFGSFGNAESPQMVVSQKGGQWQLYLEGIDSGRTDAATGQGGRTIRMSLYLTGTTAEGESVLGFLSAYVRGALAVRGGDMAALRDAFVKSIQPGDPRKWKDGGESVQSASAEAILKKLLEIRVSSVAADTEGSWCGGRNPDNLEKFIGSCRSLLTGAASGAAVCLPYCRLSDLRELQGLLNGEPLVAALSGDSGEQMQPARKIPAAGLGGGAAFGPAAERPNVGGDGKKRPKTFFLIALALVSGVLLIKCCSNTGKRPTQKVSKQYESGTNAVHQSSGNRR